MLSISRGEGVEPFLFHASFTHTKNPPPNFTKIEMKIPDPFPSFSGGSQGEIFFKGCFGGGSGKLEKVHFTDKPEVEQHCLLTKDLALYFVISRLLINKNYLLWLVTQVSQMLIWHFCPSIQAFPRT
uniref:Uncharacterized protein n=1 Tax=Micrurus lemniscatus lemniscatus TaxID=129467 RepID=A0A2D4HMM4_MICLE